MKKVYIIILMAIILFSMISFAFAEGAAPQKGDEITRIREEVELREPNADTYLLSDGSYECVVYSDNKYFENDSGELVEIDNSIVNAEMTIGEKSYSYANKANSSIIHFSNTKPAVYIESKGKSLSFEMVDAQNTEAIPGGNKKMEAISDYELSGDNYITYMDVKPQTDLVYEIKNGLLKEYIVLKSPEAPSEFSFEFGTNYSFEKCKDGKIKILDENGVAMFELGNLFAVDSAEANTEALEYNIIESDGCKNVTVSISPEYLNAPGRVFPVLIDPSTMITGESNTYDAYVSSNHPNSNYYLKTILKTGYSDNFHIRRSYIKFDIPSSVINGEVTAAKLRIRKKSGISLSSVKARRITSSWTSSTVTWNNKPDTMSTGYAFALDSDNWYKANVFPIVMKWLRDGQVNRGFELRDNIETGSDHWTDIYSSDAESPNKPELHITYVNKKKCRLVGVSANNHDHYSCLTSAKTFFDDCYEIGSTIVSGGSFSVNDIASLLDDNGNGVFLCRSHGGYSGTEDSPDYTFVKVNYGNPNVLFKSSSDFDNLNLSNMKLVMFVACKTGNGGIGGNNLPTEAVNKGAKAAVGFKKNIDCSSANQWTIAFSTMMKNKQTVSAACLSLKNSYPDSGLDKYIICGDNQTKLN